MSEEEGAEVIVYLLGAGLIIVSICVGMLTGSEVIGWLVFGGTLFVLGLVCAVVCCMSDK